MSRKRKRDSTAPPAASRIADALEFPKELIPGMANIELLGNRECVIDGCKGILEYDSDKIKLNLGGQTLSFSGQDLTIRSLNNESTVVEGLIMTMEFSS
ncbi:MAG: YabP/YqfC family sporulation protein [Clostridiales bacterium]|nr:YabP/YqfC family sporulation protein [Clostridiales bacterium]